MKRLLFLCTGNYYRSRFGEIYFNWHAPRRGLAWRAESRGLALTRANIGALSCYTVTRLTEQGIPTEPHQRLPLDAAYPDFAASDHIVAMKETEHRPLIARRFPAFLPRVEFWEMHDIDMGDPQYVLPRIEMQIEDLIDRLSGVVPHDSDVSH